MGSRNGASATEMERLVLQCPIGIAATDGRSLVRFCNTAFEDLFLYRAREARGRNIEKLLSLGTPEPTRLLNRLALGEPPKMTLSVRRKDRRKVDVQLACMPRVAHDAGGGYWCFFEDVTERVAADRALTVSHETFAQAFRSSPATVALSTGSDNRLVDVNDTWVRMTGLRRDEAVGRTLLELGLFENPEDFRRINQHVSTRGGRVLDVACRFRMRGGAMFVGLVSIEEFSAGNESFRMVTIEDTTPARNAEAMLSTVSKTLLEGQERERRRVSRVLHDDVGQRLAVLQFGIDRLRRDVDGPRAATLEHLSELRRDASTISTRVEELSRELHSAVEHLPVDAALNRLCDELAARFDLDIAFISRHVEHPVPPDVSLCLLRVTQETICHGHSRGGSRRATVALVGTRRALRLSITHVSGIPFDKDDNTRINLVTIRQRIAAVGGTFSISWMPAGGARIDASIPLAARP
jgi:PAS domain S-box-containing protein